MADKKMTVEEFNNTALGREMKEQMASLYQQQQDILTAVRELTEPVSFGSYVDYDDDGFFDNTDI